MDQPPNIDQLQMLCALATKERARDLAGIFRRGRDNARAHASVEIAWALAAMDQRTSHYTQAELNDAAAQRMASDPVFHATVRRLTDVLEDYVEAAVANAQRKPR